MRLKRLFFACIVLFLMQAQMVALEIKSPVVSVEWLKANIKNPELVLVDVRKKSEFSKGHLYHAINLPTFEYLFDKDYNIPKLSFLQEVFSKAGIDDNRALVVYGDDDMIWAARLYWISKVLGHNNVALLEVGYGNWKKGEIPITKEVYVPKRTNFVPKVNDAILKTKLDVLVSIGKAIIIDGRPRDFYLGLKSHAKRYGHIPQAINRPGSLNYIRTKTGSKMKTFDVLKNLYKDLDKSKPIILYCEDGADAALNFLVLKELGYNASVYDGSWLEWGNDPSLPIEKTPRD